MNYKLLGSKIRQLRLEKRLTQEQLSELCGISSSYIGIIERGDKKLSIETLVKIASILNSSIDYLLDDSLKEYRASTKKDVLEINVGKLTEDEIQLIIDVANRISQHFIRRL